MKREVVTPAWLRQSDRIFAGDLHLDYFAAKVPAPIAIGVPGCGVG